MEEVLELIRDQSLTMRDPQEITYRLDTLVQDVEQTESTVREVEALFEMTSQDTNGLLPPIETSAEHSSPARNRVRS